MLELKIPKQELLTANEEFIVIPEAFLKLEHSLISVSRWEEKWHIPFLDKSKEKTTEQLVDYVRCMSLNAINPYVLDHIPKEAMDKIAKYIEDPMTATWFSDKDKPKKKSIQRSNQTLTAELIYYYMIMFGIPVEFQKWHLNKLITLIRVCEEEEEARNGNGKKRSAKEISKSRAELNAYRRKMLNSKG